MSERLPPKARARILTFSELEHSLMISIRATQAHIKELDDALAMTGENDRKLDLKEQIEQRRDVMETQRERHRHITDLNAKIRRYLDLLPADTVIDAAKPPKVKLQAGQSHQLAVTELRGTIMKLIAERAQVERVALPTEEIIAQAKKWIIEQGRRARPSITASHEKFEVKFHANVENAYTPTVDVLALLCWFDAEHMEAKLVAQIEEMPRPKLAMTPLERRERLAAIKVELGDAERLEVALVDDAQDQGIIIEHRANVDIRCLLGISVTKKPNATKAA